MNIPTDERRGGTSASNAAADALCQGRHFAQRGMPDIPSEDASFGDKVHAALATGNDEGLETQQLSIVEGFREIEDKVLREAFGPELANVRMVQEERLWCKVPHVLGGPSATPGAPRSAVHYEHSAKPDKVVILGKRALVIERKSLPGDVPESSRNLQLRDQVVLAARTYGLDDVAAVVVQPLVTYTPEVCAYDAAAIARSEKEMWERVIASNNPNAVRVAGEVQCKFCKAKSTCKEYALWSKSLLPAPVSIFDVPVAEWTPDQCATFLERRLQAQRWLTEGVNDMKARLKVNPDAIPGWGLVEGDEREVVTDPQELCNRFVAIGGTQAQFIKCVGVPKGKLETQVREVTKLKGKALHAKLEVLLDGITETKKNESSIERKK